LQAGGEEVDVAAMIKGLQDALATKDPALQVEQLTQSVENMQKRLAAKAPSVFAKMAAENKTKGDVFLAQNQGQIRRESSAQRCAVPSD